MDTYRSKVSIIPGSEYKEVSRIARNIYKKIVSQTKRKPYVRSAYFNGEKVFLDYFWQHLSDKTQRDRLRRLRFYECALDLIKNSKIIPISKENVNKSSEIVHRFKGITKNKEPFFVQIKEEKRTGQKHFISVFPFD